MDFSEAMSYIDGSKIFGSKLGLHNITYLMELLGNPQRKLKFVHVAGTNGKGSVSSYINNILIKAGYRTGLFTSPHIDRFNERILINNIEIADEEVGPVCEAVKEKIDIMLSEGLERPTEFEIITAMAFVYFLKRECDVIVLEVGLGGRLDCTNVIDRPLVGVITTIDYDHVKELGDNLTDIAYEKAGIIKEGGAVVTYKQQPEAEKVLVNVCAEMNAKLYIVETDTLEIVSFEIPVVSKEDEPTPDYGQTFNYEGYKELRIGLLGEHQIRNATVAIRTAEVLRTQGMTIPESAIREGLLITRWNGRFEVLRTSPLIIIDGSHNPQGVNALAHNLIRYFGDKKILFVAGILADKDCDKMLAPVIPIASRFFTVTPNSDRALNAADLAQILVKKGAEAEDFDNVSKALEKARETVRENEVICCFGSLYYIGEARKIIGTY